MKKPLSQKKTKKNAGVYPRKNPEKIGSSGINDPVICLNSDCIIRKGKPCRGFEGCPGFRSKP